MANNVDLFAAPTPEELGAASVQVANSGKPDLFAAPNADEIKNLNISGAPGESYLRTLGRSAAESAPFAGALVGGAVGFGTGGPIGAAGGAGLGAAAGKQLEYAIKARYFPDELPSQGQQLINTGKEAVYGALGEGIGQGVSQALKPTSKLTSAELQGTKLATIAERQGLPPPTFGQTTGGSALATENALAEVPYFGKGIREQQIAQADASKKKIIDSVGDVFSTTSNRGNVGDTVKRGLQESRGALKNTANDLYGEVASRTANLNIPTQDVQKNILGSVDQYKLFDQSGTPLRYSLDSGLNKKQFSVLQETLEPIISDLSNKETINP
jgi:hypothetical protein